MNARVPLDRAIASATCIPRPRQEPAMSAPAPSPEKQAVADEIRDEREWDLLRAQAADFHAAWRTASESADRFRDVLAEALGHPDENPGDDVLVRELRKHFGKTGPEPMRWRNFLTGARAQLDQIEAMPDPIRRALDPS